MEPRDVRSHTKASPEIDGTVRISTIGGVGLSGAEANGVRDTGRDRLKSIETFNLTPGESTAKDGASLRLISRGDTPKFTARLVIHRSWLPDRGFREHVVQDSVTCRWAPRAVRRHYSSVPGGAHRAFP